MSGIVAERSKAKLKASGEDKQETGEIEQPHEQEAPNASNFTELIFAPQSCRGAHYEQIFLCIAKILFLTLAAARRIAVKIAKLPELLRR
jgi:hypothetical protein